MDWKCNSFPYNCCERTRQWHTRRSWDKWVCSGLREDGWRTSRCCLLLPLRGHRGGASSSQRRTMEGQAAAGTAWGLGRSSCERSAPEGGQTGTGAQRVCGISIPGIFKTWLVMVLSNVPWAEGWTRWDLGGISYPHNSVLLSVSLLSWIK